jgi:magnesium chelatase subunit ChlD-like protein
LAKKALSIRPIPACGADARPQAGALKQAPQGRQRVGGSGTVDWLATLLAGRPRHRADLHWQVRQGTPGELWLVIVDASASMQRHRAMADAKGVLAELFEQAYRQRVRLALLTASGARPGWHGAGMKAGQAVHRWLEALGAGGGSPVLTALDQARSWLQQRRKRKPDEQQRCLVLTDGRLKGFAGQGPLGCPTLLIDLEKGPIRLERARELATCLGADYQPLEALRRR